MAARSGCPDREELADLLAGRLSLARARGWVEHLGDCPTCVEAAAELEDDLPPLEDRLTAGEDAPILGRYRLEDDGRRRGADRVYPAFDDEEGRKVDLVAMGSDQAAGTDPSADGGDPPPAPSRLGRWIHAHRLVGLSHPNLQAVLEAAIVDGSLVVVTEHLRGRTMDQWLAVGQPSWRRVVRAYGQVAAGLAAAHDAGFVHGDLRPEHLLLGDDGRARVAGLWRGGDRGETDEVEGPPSPYWAPEQRRRRRARPRADQFALCAAFGEALCGQVPTAGVTLDELLTIIAAERKAGVPEEVLAVIAQGMRRRPRDRHGDLHEVAEELEDLSAVAAAAAAAGPPRNQRTVPIVVGALALLAVFVVALRELNTGTSTGASSASTVPPADLPPMEPHEPLPMAPMMPAEPALPLDRPSLRPELSFAFDDKTPAGKQRRQAVEKERAGDGPGCLLALRRAGMLDPKLKERADMRRLKAICLMHAGQCKEGRRQLAEGFKKHKVERTEQQLQRMIDAQAPTPCKSKEGQARETVNKVYRASLKAAKDGKVDECRALAVEVRELAKVHRGEEGKPLRSMLYGAQRAATRCIAEQGSCKEARTMWLRDYRTLFPDRLDDEQWKRTRHQMFESSFPKCR